MATEQNMFLLMLLINTRLCRYTELKEANGDYNREMEQMNQELDHLSSR